MEKYESINKNDNVARNVIARNEAIQKNELNCRALRARNDG